MNSPLSDCLRSTAKLIIYKINFVCLLHNYRRLYFCGDEDTLPISKAKRQKDEYVYVMLNIMLLLLYYYREEESEQLDTQFAEKLVIPSRFLVETTQAVKTGVLTQKARDEIISSLTTLILVHTKRPTPNDFTTICRRLVSKYPKLKDKVDGGFVSFFVTVS